MNIKQAKADLDKAQSDLANAKSDVKSAEAKESVAKDAVSAAALAHQRAVDAGESTPQRKRNFVPAKKPKKTSGTKK